MGDLEIDAVPLVVGWVCGSLDSRVDVGSLRLRFAIRLERRRDERRES